MKHEQGLFPKLIKYFSQVGAPGLLYVCQREMAAVAPHDRNVNIIGSDDATTCIIVVVRHSGKAYFNAFVAN